MRTTVAVIGAGPAGLTAAHELAAAGMTDVVVFEASGELGGLARSVDFKGNRIDIGGHRFFSKSDWVLDWWLRLLPLAPEAHAAAATLRLAYRGAERALADAPACADGAMLVRPRLSRIYFGAEFFDYPLKPNLANARKLGWLRCAGYGASYLRALAFPRRPVRNLEDFFVNRFGERLYRQFFESYTEKVWGVPCAMLSAEWGAQRVKSLSIGSALGHALLRRLGLADARAAPTSLIEHFLYPKYGPGQLWETVGARVQRQGVRLELDAPVVGLEHRDSRVRALHVRRADGRIERCEAQAVVSTMPLRDLVLALAPGAPSALAEIAAGLQYRDFIVVGLLLRRLRPSAAGAGPLNLVPDTWIYVQEPGVKLGRLQVLNNWSPYLVRDPQTVWLGLEYFCSEGDALWSLSDAGLLELGMAELERLRLAEPADRLDGTVVRVPKAYPAYHGSYGRFGELRAYLDSFENLFPVGRNGMHRYNNQDHSMLAARAAVQSILRGAADKAPIWGVNIGDDYHEAAAAA
jgi:protoporphyrinogen oxidase